MKAYRRHHESVVEYFNDRPRDLLVLNIIEGEGWDKLCRFLKSPSLRSLSRITITPSLKS